MHEQDAKGRDQAAWVELKAALLERLALEGGEDLLEGIALVNLDSLEDINRIVHGD